MIERLLACFQILLLATPGFNRWILKRPPVGKTDRPRLRQIELVDRIQMGCGEDVALPAGQKNDPGDRSRHMAAQTAQRRGCHFID